VEIIVEPTLSTNSSDDNHTLLEIPSSSSQNKTEEEISNISSPINETAPIVDTNSSSQVSDTEENNNATQYIEKIESVTNDTNGTDTAGVAVESPK
jgi:hypothetical protein